MTSQRLTQYDWLDDLCVRFLINLPKADMLDMQRLCFQAEEAHWFYDDFIRPNDKAMPRMTLREFTLAIFKQCPLLCDHPDEQLASAFDDFMKYKPTVPVRGAILLSDTMDEVLLVKGWKKNAHWGFPKGKINLNEDDLDCAIREVDEETGFDIRAAGLVPPRHEVLSITMNTKEQDTKLFIFRGVSKNTVFEAKTRKEISDIQWFRVADLPSNKKKPYHHGHGHETDDPGSNHVSASRFYLVGPFMGPLRRKIREMRERDAAQVAHGKSLPPPPQLDEAVEAFTEDEGAQPQSDYYGYQDGNRSYADEAQQYQYQQQQEPQVPAQAQAQTQQYADASRDLLSMINRPSPAASQPQPHNAPVPVPVPYADQSQAANAPKASALMAMLQTGGSQAQQPNTPHHQHYANQQGQPGPQDPFYQNQNQHQHQAPPPQFVQPASQMHQMPQGFPQFMQGQGLPQGQGPYDQYGAPQQDLAQYQYEQQQQLLRQQEYEQQQQQQIHAQQQQGQQQQQQAQQQHQTDLLALLTQSTPTSAAAPPPPPHETGYNNGYNSHNGYNGQASNPAYQQTIHQAQKAPTPTILHPQPLPPTVQKALFARDSLASPDVAAYARGQGYPNMMMPPPPPLPQQQQQAQQQVQQQAQPQQQPAPLNSHAANLLSFFKTDQQPQPQQPQQPQQAPPVQAYQQQMPAHQQPQQQLQQPQQLQQLQASRSPAAVFTEPHHPNGPRAQHSGHHHHHPYGAHYTGGGQQPLASQGVPDTLNKIINGNGNGNGSINNSIKAANTNGSSGRPTSSNPFLPKPPQSQHANSLLSMFKQTTNAVPTAPGPEVVAPVHPGVTTQQQTVYPTTTTTTTAPIGGQEAEAAAARARGNAGAVEMNSEVNLPFGALSLLSRAKANESGQSNRSSQPNQHPSTFPVPIAELPAGTATVTQTTILKNQPSYTQPGHPGAAGAVQITGRQMVDSPDHGRPSTDGSGHQYFPPPPEMQMQQQQAHVDVHRPSYASLSSAAPANGSAGYTTTAQQLLQQFQKPPQQQPPQQQPQQQQQADPQQQQKLLSLFGGGQPNVQPQQGLSLQQSMQQNLLQQFQRQTGHGHPQVPVASNMSPTAFNGVGSSLMPPPGSVSSRGSMDQRAGAANGLAPPGLASGLASGIASPENGSGASVDGLAGMRRGSSQTPISTEKRDFLLSYLTQRT